MALARRYTGAIVVLLTVCLVRLPVLAGTTGKIVGKVVDKATTEPLVGVNVVVEGTTLGAATDVNGGYIILKVAPGTYRLKASLVGYGATVVTDVRVYIDQTVTVPFELTSEAIVTGEVVVVAAREIVKKDVSTSVTAFSNEEVRTLPVTSVAQVTGLQAGVEAGLVIRGGSADQALFLLDGTTMRDPRNNQPISGVPMSAVSEISIERGGFNAEYGQLRSGIINVVTKEGGQSAYTVTATGRISPPTRKYFGISPYDPNSMWLRPYLDPAVAWTGTSNGAWDYHTQRQYPSFEGWNAVSQRLIATGDPAKALSPAAAQRLFMWEHRKRENATTPDYTVDVGVGGPLIPSAELSKELGNLRFYLAYRLERDMLLIPLSRPDYYEDNWSLRLSSDIAPTMKLDITGTLGKSFNVAANGGEQNSSTDYLITPEHITENIGSLNFNDSRVFLDSYWSLSTVKNYSLNALFTHVLGSKAFYEVRVEHVAREYDTGTPAPRDQTKKYELFPGYFVDETPFGWDSLALSGVSGMLLGGHTATARDSSKISSTSLKGSLVAQLDGHNQVKAGVEFVYNQLNLEYGVVNKAFPESNNFVHEARFPIRGALFVQDKLEFEGFIANLGLRLDYSNSNVDWWAVSQFDKSFYTFSFDPSKEYPKEKAKAAWSLSPRLGISHPITENAKLFFNYGHFKQLPTYEQLLRYSRNVTGTLRNIGDPDLLMASTIAYELGFDYSLFDEYLVQIAGFYRDITDQQDFTTYISNAASGNFQYVKPNNNSYQDIRGVEVTLRKTAGSWVTGFINYTYQSTKSGRFNKDRIYQDFTDQRKYDLDTRILYQFRPIPTPYARMSVTLFTPPDFGPTFGGNSFFGDWAVSILGDWRSGGYQTWNPNNDPSVANNVQVVDFLNFSLRTSKALTFGKTRIILFADISNLFSTKRLNLNSFYDYNDQQDYYNSLHLPAGPGYRNIPGTDKVGDYRSSDVAFQPIEQFAVVSGVGDPHVIYYETTTQRYMNYVNNTWSEVDPGRMQQVLDDKAYIDMPNETSFNFLNPRQIFFGITVALEL